MNNLLPQRIIELAIEGGYRREQSTFIKNLPEYALCQALLEPFFWKCLGNMLGWDKSVTTFKVPKKKLEMVINGKAISTFRKAHTITRPVRNAHNIWKKNHHRFIDAIHKNKVEEFWKSIIPNEKC